MKKSILTVIVLFIMAVSVKAQDTASAVKTNKVIVLVNTAKWCPACKANGKRVEENVISKFMNNENYKVVVNNLSNDKTKKESKENCKNLGILEIIETNKMTGVIFFINGNTKEILSQISVVESNEEIIKAFESSLSKF